MAIRICIGPVEMKQLTGTDVRELYCIRNHESVRRFMSKPQRVSFPDHRAYVQQHILPDPDFHLLLIRPGPDRRAIGLAQLRRNRDTAEIGLMFREPALHQALPVVCAAATLHLAFVYLGLSAVTSSVVSTHKAAIRFNTYFGATEEPSPVPGMTCLRLTAGQCLQNPAYQRVWQRIEPKFQMTVESSPGPPLSDRP